MDVWVFSRFEVVELKGETSELLDAFFLFFFLGVVGSSSLLVLVASWSWLGGDVKSWDILFPAIQCTSKFSHRFSTTEALM